MCLRVKEKCAYVHESHEWGKGSHALSLCSVLGWLFENKARGFEETLFFLVSENKTGSGGTKKKCSNTVRLVGRADKAWSILCPILTAWVGQTST